MVDFADAAVPDGGCGVGPNVDFVDVADIIDWMGRRLRQKGRMESSVHVFRRLRLLRRTTKARAVLSMACSSRVRQQLAEAFVVIVIVASIGVAITAGTIG